MSETLLQISGP